MKRLFIVLTAIAALTGYAMTTNSADAYSCYRNQYGQYCGP